MSFNISLKRNSLHLENCNTNTSPVKRRKVTSATKNEVASVSHYINLEEDVEQHAYVRIHLLYLTMLVYAGIACRSDGSLANINLKMKGARRQIGQGDEGNHAAHPDGFSCFEENMKEDIIDGIQQNKFTPKKIKILAAKGLKQEDIDYLKKNYTNIKLIKKCVEKYWVNSSLLEDSELEFILSLTNVLPRRVNLACDLPFEKKFKHTIIKELLLDVMYGKMDPDTAIKLCVLKIQDYFTNKIEKINEELNLVTNLQRQSILKDDLFYHRCQLKGSVLPNLDRFKKEIGDNQFNLLKSKQLIFT